MNGRFLLLVSFCLSLSNAAVDAQMHELPFTRDELYKVMRFALDEKEAADAVDSPLVPPRQPSGKVQKPPGNHPELLGGPGKATPGRQLAFEAVEGTTLTEDTLILLSLLSSETEKKVTAYRQARRLTAEEDRRWQERHRELEGLPEVRQWRAKFGAP